MCTELSVKCLFCCLVEGEPHSARETQRPGTSQASLLVFQASGGWPPFPALTCLASRGHERYKYSDAAAGTGLLTSLASLFLLKVRRLFGMLRSSCRGAQYVNEARRRQVNGDFGHELLGFSAALDQGIMQQRRRPASSRLQHCTTCLGLEHSR